jgi:hypothetical protein
MDNSPPQGGAATNCVTTGGSRLRYGVNETDSWWHFALGPERERIWQRLREMRTEIIRIFLFDKNAPDPLSDWELFRSYVEAVLCVGAVPMVTFAKFDRPFGDPRAVRWFAERCGEIVWNCLEEWGEERVQDWYWSIWNEPNSTWIGGGLTFEHYRDIYEHVGDNILRWLGDCLGPRRPPIGGPAVEGFEPYWMDWISRFLTEVEPRFIGFVNWHRYADWREHGENGAPTDQATHEAVMMWHTADYETRARSVARLLESPEVLNVCGEWNAHSHYLPVVRARFNQSHFGAAYGASALLHLIRGAVDAEMLWTGTDDACGYGVLDPNAVPTPLFYARRLCAQYIRRGDSIVLAALPADIRGVDGMVIRGDRGRKSILLSHCEPTTATYCVGEFTGADDEASSVVKIDQETGSSVTTQPCDGTITFAGYGVAVLTNAIAGCDVGSQSDWI